MTDYDTIIGTLYIAQGIALIGLGINLIKLGRCLTKGQIYPINNFKNLAHPNFESDNKLERLTKN